MQCFTLAGTPASLSLSLSLSLFSRAAPPRKESMPSFISPLTRDDEREGEREGEGESATAVAARAKTFFYLTLPPPPTPTPMTSALQFFPGSNKSTVFNT